MTSRAWNGEKTSLYRILIGKTEAMGRLGRLYIRRWEDNINAREMGLIWLRIEASDRLL
jgi:hypothetical protein